MMDCAVIEDQSKTAIIESSSLKDGGKLSNIVDHTLIPIWLSTLCGTSRKKYALWPAPHRAALPDDLPVGSPERRALQE